MKLVEFTTVTGDPVAIPIDSITGIMGDSKGNTGCFVATGSGDEDGWYVADSYEDVKAKLESLDTTLGFTAEVVAAINNGMHQITQQIAMLRMGEL